MQGIQGGMSMSTDMMAQMREQMFAKLDGDGDGSIDLSQLTSEVEGSDDPGFAAMVEHLSAADTDGDGLISQAEFEAMEPPPPPDGPPPGPPPGEADTTYEFGGTAFDAEDTIGQLLETLG